MSDNTNLIADHFNQPIPVTMDYATAVKQIDFKPQLPDPLMYVLSRYTIDRPIQVSLGTTGYKVVIYHHPTTLVLTLRVSTLDTHLSSAAT